MNKNESGAVNVLLIIVVVVSLIAIGFAVAFISIFNERDHYINEVDEIVAVAVDDAKAEQKEADKITLAEELKKPYLTFGSPADFGSVSFEYPKTWAGYQVDNSNSRFAVYYAPKTVPNVSSKDPVYALRVGILDQDYKAVLKNYEPQAANGNITITPIRLGEHDGMRADGKFDEKYDGALVIFKIGSKTLVIRTDAQDFIGDFNNVILPSLKFTVTD